MLDIRRELRFFENKRILIWGYGAEGQSTLQFLQRKLKQVQLTVLDEKEISLQDSSVEMVQNTDFNKYDYIFKSPGIVIDYPGFPVEKLVSQTSLFIDVFRDQIVGITGTKGKSTTCSLLAHVLRGAQKDVKLVGNIGVPCLDVWDEIKKDTVIVFEMSCHQMEFIQNSPHMAVLLNIYPEHLDHYDSFESYKRAKENIYRYQKQDDVLIVNEELKPQNSIQEVVLCSVEHSVDIHPVEGGFVVFDEHVQLPTDSFLIGKHNIYNAAIVYALAKRLGVRAESFLEAYKTFKPLAHRLESIGSIDGVTYIDDSISTVPQSTIAAIKSLSDVDCVLIGGMDRGIDYEELIQYLKNSSVSVIIFMYESGKRIASQWRKESNRFIYEVETLEDAVVIAKEKTAKGKICLLSPAAASYGVFKNFAERGERFKELVQADV